MAELSGLPAMDINPALYGAQSGTAALGEMSALQDYQTKSQLAPIAVHDAQTASRLGDVKAGQDEAAAANAALAQVARDAQAADPEDAPGIWDAGMKKAAAAGATVASQYVGHYRPDLAERVGASYGGQQGAGSGGGAGSASAPGSDPAVIANAVAQMPPDKITAALGNLNRVITSFNGVKDEESWNNEMQALQQAGIDVSKFLPNLDWNPMNYAAAHRVVQSLTPYRDAMASRAAMAATGVPTPAVPREVKEAGGVLYSLDPYGRDATPLTKPTPSYEPTQAIGPDGRPLMMDKTTGLPPPTGSPMGDFTTRVMAAENPSGNPAQPNVWGGSSAVGNGQFVNGTWLKLMKDSRPDLTKGKSDAEILAMRSDPALSARMIQTYATQNADALHKAGLPVTTATLYLAHGFGADGATKILQAPVNAPVSSILPKNVIAANPYLKNMTAGQLAQQFAGKVGNDPVQVGAQLPANTPTGSAALRPLPQYINPKDMDQPKEVEVPDGKGGTHVVLAQQYKPTGQWVTADGARTPLDTTDMRLVPAGSMPGGGGGRFAAQILRVQNSARQAANELGNISSLPISASTGLFGGAHQGPSLMDAPATVLANEVTTQDVQSMRVSMVGMGRALASIEAFGLSPPGSLTGAFDQLALKEGDTNLTKLQKLATMGQDASAGLQTLLSSSMLGKKQADDIKGIIDQIHRTIPYTPQDVIALQRAQATNPNATMKDFASGIIPPKVTNQKAFDALRHGAVYVGTDGKKYRKP